MATWFFCVAGVFLILTGIISKTLVNESKFPASGNEKQAATATPLKRLLVVFAGLAALAFGAVGLLHLR